ncbi:MAG: flagellar basal body P-ring formation protein FlgA [Candidatus Nitronauta litoralis]|uniref:Flagella basal body P-ring formation protein FlgA n=1 Tax=Candidatus Nitronauta litoralis TaxID=2705533 RepID=A0A7T0G006_9BACT|nr:MAG: flagellar basal body P-ring formation protein FlgA [Candidatus Nitronauta litoralis]
MKIKSRLFQAAPWLSGLIMVLLLCTPPVFAGEYQELTGATITESARNYLLNEMDWDPNDVEVKVDYTGKALSLPEGELKMDFQLAGNHRPIGRIPLSLVLTVDGEMIRKIWLNARVNVFFDVVQTTRPVPRNRVLTSGDVEIVRVMSSRPLRNIIYDPNEVIGQQTVRDIDHGQNISPYMVKRVPLVKRGDRVLIVAERNRLRITAPGVVKEPGFKDTIVQVENQQTKKIIHGTVIDAKTIKVEF